ncbi:P-loop containing nucleoside triphosphate hydrolase protein [Wilcoxina mikolae CBS 423.85]|nr:P-loop containing nucleoside triphosphate hydrolase protein [Wilcoxina mikolae CBS 423.85]
MAPVLPLSASDYKIEIKHLEQRFDDDQYYTIGEPVSGGPPPKDRDDKWREWALCVIRNFDHQDNHTSTTLQIKSPQIKELLKNVIGDKYPGVSFSTENIQLDYPLKSLWHYRSQLREEAERLQGLEKEHAEFFVRFLDEEFEETDREVENLTEQGLITYPLLWTIFKPAEVVYTAANDYHPFRAYRHYEGTYLQGQCPQYRLSNEFVTYDGEHFGTAHSNAAIGKFAGTRKITRLPVFPLDWHPQADIVREKLIARGQKFESLRGKQYCYYTGITLGDFNQRSGRIKKFSVNGPIMIDCEIFGKMVPDRANVVHQKYKKGALKPGRSCVVDDGYDSESELDDDILDDDFDDDMENEEPPAWKRKEDPKTYRPLTQEQHLICDCMVHGFAFSEKLWVQFAVDLVQPPVWNDKAFDQLVLPATQKSLVRALVDSHVKEQRSFDDFIKGKGRGLVAILHGPPGVGKTLTAESVAHASRRPLYAVSSGELGIDAKELESNLARILDMASAWKAVVLLDEADVFLEKRSQHDLKRNALVSIFLRLLEYYQGILFLTTNRVKTFDEAFQSRIHVALKYSNLEVDARRSVWRNFLERIENGGVEVGEEGYDRLARHELNGREIKNAIGTAKTLADAEGAKLDVERLEVVLKIQQEFEEEMRE